MPLNRLSPFFKVLLVMDLILLSIIGYMKTEMHFRQKYGVVRDDFGSVYRPAEYGGYERAMNACLWHTIETKTYGVCHPRWK